MLRKVKLYGSLGDEFGREFELDVKTPVEAIRAFAANFGTVFLNRIKEGNWHILAGEDIESARDYGDESMLSLGLGSSDLHILPALEGSSGKGGGLARVVIGIVIVVAAIYSGGTAAGGMSTMIGSSGYTYGQMAAFGAVVAMSGMASVMANTPSVSNYGEREEVDERPSFLFTGAKNTTEQGGPIPLIYGEHRTGWTLVSSGITLEEQ